MSASSSEADNNGLQKPDEIINGEDDVGGLFGSGSEDEGSG